MHRRARKADLHVGESDRVKLHASGINHGAARKRNKKEKSLNVVLSPTRRVPPFSIVTMRPRVKTEDRQRGGEKVAGHGTSVSLPGGNGGTRAGSRRLP
jgi:hypothetical protein